MVWYIPVILRVLMAHAIYPWVSKHVVMKHSRSKRQFLNFSLCAVVACIFAACSGQMVFSKTTSLIFCVGIANGWAAYCQWSAQRFSLSRNSLLTFGDDITAMGLSYLFLNETRFLNLANSMGIALSVVCLTVFAIRDYHKKPEEGVTRITPSFYFYVSFYSVVWGIAGFFMRKWGLERVPVGTFISSWYAGAWVGSLSIFLFIKMRYREKNPSFTKNDFGFVALMGSLIMICLALGYMALERAPQTIVTPIFLVSEMVLPTIIGLFFFGEKKGFKFLDWFLVGASIAGGVLVGLSYHS